MNFIVANPARPADSNTRVLEKNSQKLENPFTRKYYPDICKDGMDGKITTRPALSITNIQIQTEQDPAEIFLQWNQIKGNKRCVYKKSETLKN